MSQEVALNAENRAIDNVPMARRPSPALAQWWVAQILQSLRADSGMSAARVAKLAGLNPTTVTRYESFERRPHPNHVRSLMEAYGQPPAVVEAVVEIATGAQVTPWYVAQRDLPPWLAMFVGLETAASRILSWQPLTVPGLLQVEGYARALLQCSPTPPTAEQIDSQVAFRMSRQELLLDDDAPQFVAVVAESALRNPIGWDKVMADQIARLIELSERPNIDLHILPARVGAHAGLDGSFVVLDFPSPGPNVPPIYRESTVYVQGARGALYLDDPEDVAAYRAAHDQLVELSTSGDETRELLRTLS